MSDQVRVEGVAEASRAYQAIAADARDMTEPNRRIAAAGEDAARARAPIRTGRLSGSIQGSATAAAAELRVGVPYWPFVEFGTRWIQAQHFAKAGMDAMSAVAPDAYRARMAAIIEKRT